MQKKARLGRSLSLVSLILGISFILVACQQAQPLTPTPIGENTDVHNTDTQSTELQDLFTKKDIENAILQIADSVTVVPIMIDQTVADTQAISDARIITTDSNGEEDSLTTLVDVNNLSGYVCSIINNTNGRNKWRIQSVNAADESVIGLFSVKQDGRAMQSIGCNAFGNKAVFAMKTSAAADYEIFLLDYTGSTRQAYQLTDNSTNDIDVSMSADGSVVVWQSWIGSDKVITVREYAADGSFTDTVLDGAVPYVEPSVNSDGTLIVFLDIRDNQSNLLKHNLNTGNTVVVYTASGKRSLAHPSISNDGQRIAWIEGADDENFKVKDIPSNTIIEIVNNNLNLDHGFLADDGNSVVYSINRSDKAFTKVKNVDDGTIKNVGRVLQPPARYRGSVWVEAGVVNQTPEITSYGGASITNVNIDENITFVENLEATDDNDSEGSGLTWSLVSGADSGNFSLHSITGALSFITPPDYENPQDSDADNSYTIVVEIADSEGASDLITINIVVINIPDAVVYVDIDASGNDDGTSWTDAFPNLQDALECLRNSDLNCIGRTEVWVAEGVYYPDVGATVTNNDESESFYLVPNIAIYGGFDGAETKRSQRNPNPTNGINSTILSGDIDENDSHGGDNIAATTADIIGNNSYHVVFADALGLEQNFGFETILDGFTITAGQANGPAAFPIGDDDGGGLVCYGHTSLPLPDYTCMLSLKNLQFSGNNATDSGGAISIRDAELNLENSLLVGNDQTALFTSNSTVIVENSQFLSNSSGLGAAIRQINGDLTISNSSFMFNDSGNGGALYLSTGGSGVSATAAILNTIFIGNKSVKGGAVYATDTDFSITNSAFSGNEADNHGGAIFISIPSYASEDFNIPLTNLSFSKNIADAVASFGGLGGSIYIDNGTSITSGGTLTVDVANSILWNSTDTSGDNEIYSDGAIVILKNNIVKQGLLGIVNINGGVLSNQGGNLQSTPRFISADGADGIPGTADDNLRLKDSSFANISPAIDAGDSDEISETTDLDGNDRFVDETAVPDTGNNTTQDSVVDMGAYEVQ